jgi:hypothetical protein
MRAELEWLIVGGGVHGTYLSHVLLAACGVPADRLRVIAPHEVPLARFTSLADAVGFRYLRSPSVHHLDLDPYSLRTFITRRRIPEDEAYAAPYDRPAWSCFQAHTTGVIRRARLQAVRATATVTRLRAARGGFAVDTDCGVLRSRRVILAVGGTGAPAWPAWAPRESDRVRHVFGPIAPTTETDSLLVIGGGMRRARFARCAANLPRSPPPTTACGSAWRMATLWRPRTRCSPPASIKHAPAERAWITPLPTSACRPRRAAIRWCRARSSGDLTCS